MSDTIPALDNYEPTIEDGKIVMLHGKGVWCKVSRAEDHASFLRRQITELREKLSKISSNLHAVEIHQGHTIQWQTEHLKDLFYECMDITDD